MRKSVDLDDQAMGQAAEIRHVRPDRVLSAKLVPLRPLPQFTP